VETEVSPSNFIFAAKYIVADPEFSPPSKMKFERLTFARESSDLQERGKALVLFPVHEYCGYSITWAAVETEVSPSNFIFAAKYIVADPEFSPPSKMKFERLTFARESSDLPEYRGYSITWAVVETEVSPSNFIFAAKYIVADPEFSPPSKMKFERLTFARESSDLHEYCGYSITWAAVETEVSPSNFIFAVRRPDWARASVRLRRRSCLCGGRRIRLGPG
jgi:hypothetical protein